MRGRNARRRGVHSPADGAARRGRCGTLAAARPRRTAVDGELMPTLTITRGLPGSGKTAWAKQQGGHVRVNRDELRRMLHGGPLHTGWAEVQVTLAQRAQIEALLRAGINVIADDTNLRAKVVRELAELARACAAAVVVHDFTDVPVDECVTRDALRPEGERVGEDVIRTMWQRYLAGRRLPLPVPTHGPVVAPWHYRPPGGMAAAVLVH